MRVICWRPGNWLFAFHPGFVRWSTVPRISGHGREAWGWAFVWLGCECSYARMRAES